MKRRSFLAMLGLAPVLPMLSVTGGMAADGWGPLPALEPIGGTVPVNVLSAHWDGYTLFAGTAVGVYAYDAANARWDEVVGDEVGF